MVIDSEDERLAGALGEVRLAPLLLGSLGVRACVASSVTVSTETDA